MYSSVCNYCAHCNMYIEGECKGLLDYDARDCIRCGYYGGKNGEQEFKKDRTWKETTRNSC